ncbi:MAG: type II toxin-antitoxin system RelE/ParE family toxin [Methanosarcinales archaeon]
MSEYKVFKTKKANKFLSKLPKNMRERIEKKLKRLINPFSISFVKVKGSEGVYRIRVGNYRILYKVYEEKKIVVVLKIDKRSRVYR